MDNIQQSKPISQQRKMLEQEFAHIHKHENPVYLNLLKNSQDEESDGFSSEFYRHQLISELDFFGSLDSTSKESSHWSYSQSQGLGCFSDNYSKRPLEHRASKDMLSNISNMEIEKIYDEEQEQNDQEIEEEQSEQQAESEDDEETEKTIKIKQEQKNNELISQTIHQQF